MADAPPVVAQSADGVLHQFPAGTDMSVVDGVMKQYAIDHAPPPPPKPPEEPQGLIEPGAMGNKAAQTAVGDLAKTVGGAAAIAKGIGHAETGQSSTDLDMMRAIDDGSDFGKLMKAAPNDLARVALRQYQLADADQRQEMKQAAINKMAGPPSPLEHGAEQVMRSSEKLTEAGKEAFPVTPQEDQRTDVMVAGMLTGLAKYIGIGVAGGMPALIGVAGVDAYGETYDKAKTAGATDEDAVKAAALNGATQGMLMALPIGQATKVFDAVPPALRGKLLTTLAETVPALKSKLAQGAINTGMKAGEGAATLITFSQLSTLTDNIVAKNTYDPQRPVLQGVGENLLETGIAGAILPMLGAGANRLFRGTDQVPNPKAVLDAPNLNDAIAKADQVAGGGAVDVEAMAAQAKGTAEQQQAKVLKLFSGLNEGEVRPTEDGGYAYHVGNKEMPLEVWDEKKAESQAEGEEAQPTISPNVAADLRKHYGKLGVDVVYINDPDGKVPFDGAVDPQQPNTIFLSNNPQRAVAQVAGHELTHVFEATTLPDGTRLGDVLHDQIRRGLTPEGLDYANKVFGKAEAGAPQRAAFPEGDEGDAAHADAYMRHLITEIGADIGGEAPKFQTFLPKIVNEVQARYGDETAKGIVKKLIGGIRQTVQTLRDIFFKPEELNQYGPADTASQHWVTNLGEIHDTLAKMYAERFGTQAEKTNAALRDMKDKAQRDRLLKAPETPPGGAAEAAGPQGAEKAPEGQPPPGTAPAAPAAPPAAYEVSRQKAATYKRWLGEMQGGNPRDIEKVRKAYQAERQRMADILATMPAEQVGGTGPQRQLNAPALVTPPPRPAATPENVYQPETHGAEPGSAPTAPTPEAAPAVPAAPAAAPGAPSAAFAEKIRTEKERVWADKGLMGAVHRGVTRNEQFATDVARERVMREEAAPQIEEAIERGIPPDAMEAIARFYRPGEGETVPAAFDKAVDRWITIEEAKAAHHFGDEDVATYDMLTKEGQSDPVLSEAFRLLNEHYEGHVEKELPGDEDIPLGTGEAAAPEGAGEEAPRAEVGRPGGEEAGGEPGRGGEVPPHEGGPLGPQFSPRETPLLNTPEATPEELAARQRQRDKEEAEARMRGRKGGKVAQESADETPLFGGPRQGALFSPKSDEPFFSSLKRGVEALRIEKAAPGQWEATIKNMPGVKAEERAWVGIEDWLRTQTKPVTKAEVLGYINEHEVRVGEVAKGVRQKLTPEEKTEMVNLGLSGKLNAKQKARYDELNRKELGSSTKFGSYVLPGGKNYKELLLTLPHEEEGRVPDWRTFGNDLLGKINTPEDLAMARRMNPHVNATAGKEAPEKVLADIKEARTTQPPPHFKGGHWDEPNVLAHIRMDDRTGPNGEKVLHVAEIQSDWHQKGRKQGYAPTAEERADIDSRYYDAVREGRGHEVVDEYNRRINDATVPNAPFKTSWPELAMKRVMRYAAENGYDHVSWDTGQTNADRYDLSHHIDQISHSNNGDGTFNVSADKGHEQVWHDDRATPEIIADTLGKEIADKVVNGDGRFSGGRKAGEGRMILSGLDLRVGGEGMRAFYDKQLPLIANKIGKRFGAKVEDTAINAGPDEAAAREAMRSGNSEAIGEATGDRNVAAHSIPVTPAMREGVMQGQPLFSPRITDESRRKDKAYEDARPVYAALGRAPETQTIAQRWEKFKDQLGKRMLIATVDKYLATKSIDPMAYMAQRNFNSSSGALEVLLTKGTLKLNGSAFDFAQRNGGVETQVIRPLHGEHGDWAWWVAANRADRLSQEDREHLFTPAQIATLKKTNQGQLDFDYELPNGTTTRSREAAFMDTLRKYDEFNKNVMGLGVKAGLFKQETVDKLWANPFYVPFFRVAEKEGAAPFTGGQKTGGFAKQYGFKTLTGGTGKLHNDLWQNVIGNWGHLIDAAGKNIGANQVLDAAERTGVAGKVTQQQYDHQMTKADRDNTTWTMVDGKKQYWHVSDPLLFDAVSAIHSANFTDPFSKAANFFSRTLRMGVTSDPGFMLRVTIKDSEQAVATAPMSYNVLGNIVKGYRMTDLPGALWNVARAAAGMHEQALKESDELISVMAGGGLMRLGAGHAEGFRRTTAEAMSGEDLTWADGFRYIKRGARQVKEVLAQSEDINRAALYSELIKRGVPHDEATFAARDLEDFTLSGAAPWVRWIAHSVTFLNAGAQGLYKVGRSAADADRNVTAAVGGKVAWAASRRVATVMTATVLATLALDYIYRNNEDYKKRAEYDRNGKWWFHIGKYQFQIPMGFELAGLSRIATNALDMFFDKEMTGRRWANNALSIIGQNMFMNPTPQVIAPLLDVRTNTTGTGQPIEPKGMENLRPEEKFSSQNTLAARGISTVGNKIARGIGGPTAEFSSPMQLDYLWNGYTGWLGSAILGSADRVARQFTHEPARPAADLWNVATRGVVSQGPTPQSRYIDTMYQQAEAADKAYGTYEDLIKRQQFQKAQDFYKENADLINRRGLVDAVVRSEASLNQQVRLIQNNPNPQVTGEQKRLMIQQLQAIRNKTAESVFGAQR